MERTTGFAFILFSCLLLLINTVHSDSGDLIESWKKINANYADDIEQSNKIYSKIKVEEQALAELRSIVERHLRTKYAERVVNAVHAYNISTPTDNLKEISKELSEHYDSRIIDAIFAEAINEIILSSKLSMLPSILWTVFEQNDTKSFEIMLRAQLQLGSKLGQRYHIDEKEFFLHFAHRLYKIKMEPLYQTVDLSLKLKVQKLVDQLPYNLKHLYFMPFFCLLNIKHSTYIYTAIEAKVDPLTRYIWLWRDSTSMDDTGFIKAEIGELPENDDNKLNVALKGIKYDMFYYMMPNSMNIGGWDSSDMPINYIWNIEFLDSNRVMISQNDYLMCGAENHDNDRRNVVGRKRGEVSSMYTECQWRLGQCIFK